MFIFMVRDPLGIATSAKLLLIWTLSFFIAKLGFPMLNIALLIVNITYLSIVSKRLHASKDDLKIEGEWGQTLAFPKTERAYKIVRGYSITTLMALPIGLIVWLHPKVADDGMAQVSALAFGLMGCAGLYGLIFLWTAPNQNRR